MANENFPTAIAMLKKGPLIVSTIQNFFNLSTWKTWAERKKMEKAYEGPRPLRCATGMVICNHVFQLT